MAPIINVLLTYGTLAEAPVFKNQDHSKNGVSQTELLFQKNLKSASAITFEKTWIFKTH